MFNYKGYSAERLERLSNINLTCRGLNKRVYWSSENYGIGRAFRAYAGDYPSYLPLYIYSLHAASSEPKPALHELETTAEAMVVWTSASCDIFSKEMPIPCYQVTMPYVWYRREKGYEKLEEAKGTLIMPVHSTPQVDVVFDVDKHIDDMKALPDEFHPVCFCLAAADINKGLHHAFLRRDVPVYTVGHGEDVRFVDRLYCLMRNFKYTMSNHVGSAAYYSVEMGIPFSLYGDRADLINHSSPNRPQGKIDFTQYPHIMEKQLIFQGLNMSISKEQAEFVNKSMGIGEGLSREEFSELLWSVYKKRGNRFFDAASAIRRKVKYFFKTTTPF